MVWPNRHSNVYDLEYFSGAQMNMYIGDVFIDEVTSLTVQVEQKKMPIYGYASQLFDKVAKGTVLVQGTFTINFKESGYLHRVLKRFKDKSATVFGTKNSPFISSTSFSSIPNNRTGGARQDKQYGFLQRQNLEQIEKSVDAAISGKSNGQTIRPEEYIDYYLSITGFNNPGDPSIKGTPGAQNSAEKAMEIFEDKVWGSDDLSSDSEGRRGDSNVFDDFTIYITMGDYNQTDGTNHTVKRIDNVHIIGQGQTIVINGEPIAEQYSFFARNFV